MWLVKKGARRPGLGKSALPNTQRDVNFPNDLRGEKRPFGDRYRRGSKEHMLKDHPNPFTPVLAFAPNPRGSGPKPKSRPGRILAIDSAITDNQLVPDSEQYLSPSNLPDVNPENADSAEPSEPPDNVMLSSDRREASWLQAVEDIMTGSTIDFCVNVSGDISAPNSSVDYSASVIIIDCGETSSLAGVNWITRETEMPYGQMQRNMKPSQNRCDSAIICAIVRYDFLNW